MKSIESLTDIELLGHLSRSLSELPDAPAAWQAAAISLWSAPASALGTQALLATKALARFVVATLTFDSWAMAGVAHGMRSARNPTRHLLFNAEGRDVDIRIAPGPEHFVVSGQIFGPDESGRVDLSPAAREGEASRSTVLDPLSEFRFDGIPAGRYRLTFHLGADPIDVPLDIGELAR